MERRAQARKYRDDVVVLLARVGLRRYRVESDAQLLRQPRLETVDVFQADQFDVGGGGAHRSLETFAADRAAFAGDAPAVFEQVLRPHREPVAEGGRLGWLDVRECHHRQVGILVDFIGKRGKQAVERSDDEIERAPQAEGVGVVLYVHAGRAQVDDAAGRRALFGVGLYLGHQVVPDIRLDGERPLDVDIAGARGQLVDLFLGYNAEFRLDAGQAHPYRPPEPPLGDVAPSLAHRRASVAPAERRLVDRMVTHVRIVAEAARSL